ncbi:SH3 domain-containing protein [Mesorhizobium sp. 1B3]|uniref:SH3 domain-containing protein n=1 Tax=Mesorhizobium sp. 1B3 TaxID=3243599 RepID=UPI003D95B429
MYKETIIACLAAVCLLPTGQALATSGPGCLVVVNVEPGDALNMRKRPSASSPIIDELTPGSHGIIHLDSPCEPLSRPWGSRWCKVSHYNADKVTEGWVKARYVRDSDCP